MKTILSISEITSIDGKNRHLKNEKTDEQISALQKAIASLMGQRVQKVQIVAFSPSEISRISEVQEVANLFGATAIEVDGSTLLEPLCHDLKIEISKEIPILRAVRNDGQFVRYDVVRGLV